MKIYLFLFFVSIHALTAYSQNFTVGYSGDFKIVESRAKNKTIKNSVYHKGYIYSAVNNKSVGIGKWVFTKLFDLKQPLQLTKYDVNMNEVKEYALEDGDKKFAPVEPQLIQLGDKLLLGYFKPFKKESYDFYLAEVDNESLVVSDEVKVFSVPVDNVGLFKLEEELNRIAVCISVSPDQTHLLTGFMRDGFTVSLKVFDSNLKLEKQLEARVSGNQSVVLMSTLLTTSNYIFCSFSTSFGDARVLVFDPAGKKREMKSPTFLPGKYVYNILFQPAKDSGTVYFYSTYTSIKGDGTYCNGFFCAGYDMKRQELAKPAINELGTAFAKTLAEKGGGGGSASGIVDFLPILTQLDNGNLVISGSPTTSSQSVSQTGNKSTVWSSSQVGSVFSVFLNPDLSIQSYVIVPRSIVLSLPESRSGSVRVMQAGRISVAYSGLYIIPKGEGLVIVYSDYEKNVNQGLDKPTYSARTPDNLILTETEVHKDGVIASRKQITEDQKGMYTFYLTEALFSAEDNSLLIPVGKQGLNFNANKDFYNKWCILKPAQ